MDLKKLRLDQGLSIKDMAALVGKSVGSWSNYENNRSKVPDSVYQALSKHFGLSLKELGAPITEEAAPAKEPLADDFMNKPEEAPEEKKPAKKTAAKKAKEEPKAEGKTEKAEKAAKAEPKKAAPKAEKAAPKAEKAAKAESKKAAPKAEKPAPAKKTAKAEKPALVIQSVMGGEITPEEIYAKVAAAVDNAEYIYVKPEENKAYWATGNGQKGFVLLWE